MLSKGTLLRSIGDRADTVGLVLDGLVRCYYIDSDGADMTRGFGFDGGMIMDEGVLGYSEYICITACTLFFQQIVKYSGATYLACHTPFEER